MSFGLTVTVTGTSAPAKVYDVVEFGAGGNSIRRDAAAGDGNSARLLIKHEVVKKGSITYDRHLVQWEFMMPDASTSEPVTATVHSVINAPRTTIGSVKMLDLVDQMRNFLIAGNVTKLLNGEP